MSNEASSESLIDILDAMADDLEDVGSLLPDPPEAISPDHGRPPSIPPPSARPSRRSSLPPSMRAEARGSVRPGRTTEPFARISAAGPTYPDQPPQIEPVVRVPGTAAQVLATFKWV